jgi:hypothetical protein
MPRTPNDRFNKKYPITPNQHDVGQQFINRVMPLMDKMRSRPLDSGYSIHFPSPAKIDGFIQYSANAQLHHNGVSQGGVAWNPHTGFVTGLELAPGHRHMTAQLLTAAWDHARQVGAYGPSTSDNVNEFSGPIVQKYNPESTSFKESRYVEDQEYEAKHGPLDENGETAGDRHERLGEELEESWRRNAYMCHDCNGVGQSVLHKRENGQWQEVAVQEHYAVDEDENHRFMQITRHPDHGTYKPEGYNPAEHGYDMGSWGTNSDLGTKLCPTCDGDAVDF